MDLRATEGVASRFEVYIEHLRGAIGHADRREPLTAYCTGLLLLGERKSAEPMAARIAPDRVSAKHQSLHHFVAKAPWHEAMLLGAVRSFVLPKIEQQAPLSAWKQPEFRVRRMGPSRIAVASTYSGPAHFGLTPGWHQAACTFCLIDLTDKTPIKNAVLRFEGLNLTAEREQRCPHEAWRDSDQDFHLIIGRTAQ